MLDLSVAREEASIIPVLINRITKIEIGNKIMTDPEIMYVKNNFFNPAFLKSQLIKRGIKILNIIK